MVIERIPAPSVLDRLFSSKARVRILALFLLHPGARFHAQALAKSIGIRYSAVWKELVKLERAGILVSDNAGRIKYYSLEPRFPILNELRIIFLKTVWLGDAIRQALSDQPNIYAVFIYGSFASGEMDTSSDIDLMVLGEVDLGTMSPLIMRLEKELGRSINYAIFGKNDWHKRLQAGDPFLTNVLTSPRIMLLGNEDALRRIGAAGQDQALSRQAGRNQKTASGRRPRSLRSRTQSGR